MATTFIATTKVTRNFADYADVILSSQQSANIGAMRKTLERFPWLNIKQFRTDLAQLARSFTFFPEDDGASEWICFRDDDDVHLRIPSYVFNVPEDVVMVAWSTDCVSFIPNVMSYVHFVNYRVGAATGSYAVRRRWYNSLTDAQRVLVNFDHWNVHRYVHWSGYRYFMFSEVIGTVYLIHPVSITAGTMNFQGIDYEYIKKVRDGSIIPYVREAANLYLSLTEPDSQHKLNKEKFDEKIQG
ncbi:MAG: hypothetical protein QXW98_04215 [Candidatus Caldarchaeum sp.]